ncbi:MAG TPA: cation:proton antiporter [Vicinamibacterales bacterium]|nr:cation:proton antiporter [Vicinamibacterales bacterium]
MIRRVAALLIVLALAFGLGLVVDPDTSRLQTTALALGVALLAASLVGDLLERVRLPRLTGYLLFGVLAGPYVLNIITRPMARDLQVLDSLAVALIAFVAGLEMNLARLRRSLGAILTLGGVTLGVMYLALMGVLWAAWPWLPIDPGAGGLLRFAQAAALTTIVVSFSPAATMAVIAESRARGPLTETTLAVVIMAEIVLIVVFTLVQQLLRHALGAGGGAAVAVSALLAWELLGSVALGSLLGAIFALYLRQVGREVSIVLLVLCAVLMQLTRAFQVELLLTALAAGFVVENLVPPEGEALKDAVERGSPPVLVIFFAAAGASLQIDALAEVGLFALALAVLRMLLLRAGSGLAMRLPSVPAEPANLVWMGLVSQAGVVLGLAITIARQFPGWGLRLQTLVLALVAINQFVGPAVFRLALGRAGEAGAAER